MSKTVDDNVMLAAGVDEPFAIPTDTDVEGGWEERGIWLAGRLALGLNRLFGRRATATFGILVYHSIVPEVPGIQQAASSATPEQFREQIAGLLGQGFEIWSLDQVLECHREGTAPPEKVVLLTFDDGYENVYRYALPILDELAAASTIFVSTGYLDSEEPFPFDTWSLAHRDQLPPDYYRPMTTAQCRGLAGSKLVELGAHTHTHQDFRGRSEEFQRDLAESVRIIRELSGRDRVSFAFPFGMVRSGFTSAPLTEAARRVGVTCALTSEPVTVSSEASDPFEWGRFNVFRWDDSATLAAKLDGWFSWAPRLRQWTRRRADGGETAVHVQEEASGDA